MKQIDNETWPKFSEAHAKLDAARREAERIIEEANTKLAQVAEQANAALEGAFTALDDAASDAEAYYDERSEKWQGGDAGQAYAEWRDELANARDTLGNELLLEVEMPEGFSILEDMLSALDGGFRQSPED